MSLTGGMLSHDTRLPLLLLLPMLLCQRPAFVAVLIAVYHCPHDVPSASLAPTLASVFGD